MDLQSPDCDTSRRGTGRAALHTVRKKNIMRSGNPEVPLHNHPPSRPHTPRQNRLLAALPAAVYRRLLPCLELVALPLGPMLRPGRGKTHYAYFPTTSVLAMSYALDKNTSAKGWQIGKEGAAGLASLCSTIQNDRTEVQTAGHAFRLAAHALRTEFRRDGAFQQLLLRYLQALIAQVSRLGVCNQYHLLDQRLCRFLLRAFDQASANELAITQQTIADLLGVRRVGVTEAAGRLQAQGLIRCGRGRIALLDRRKLETRACACYAAIKKEFDALCRRNAPADERQRSAR